MNQAASVSQERPSAAEQNSLEKAIPQEAGSKTSGMNTAVIQTSYAGAATVSLSNTASGSDRPATSKPVVKRQAGKVAGEKPAYPADAKAAGWEGSVLLLVVVGTDGSVQSVSVYKSSGYGVLDDAAAAAVKRWRFSPASRNGVPVEGRIYVEIGFNLADEP